MNDLSTLWNTILTQKAWSWTLLGILNLLVFLIVRSFFFRPVLKKAKALNSKWYSEFKKAYFRRSLAGWVFFLLSLLIVIFAWQTANFRVFSLYEAGLCGLIALSLLVAIIEHVMALSLAAIHVLKQVENNQMSL